MTQSCVTTTSIWPFIFFLSGADFFVKCACSFIEIPCFTFMQVHVFMQQSYPAQPQTQTPLLAAQQHHRCITHSRSPLCCLVNSLLFTMGFSISKIILFTFKTWEAVIHQAAAVAYWADCALRLHRVTVHHDGSSINWKSVSYSGAWLKCGVLCFCDKDSGRWRDTGRARSEEGEERRGPEARHAGSQSNACGESAAGDGVSSGCLKVD